MLEEKGMLSESTLEINRLNLVKMALLLLVTVMLPASASKEHNFDVSDTSLGLNLDYALEGLTPIPGRNVSISPFPYDLTISAIQNVNKVVNASSDIYTVQLDNGIPWQDALENNKFERAVMEQWERHRDGIGANQDVYLAIAPLQDDRISWATDHDGKKAPSWVRKEKKINDRIVKAYINYIGRAIEYFSPRYINIGVEAGDLAAKKPRRWPALEQLFFQTYQSVKEHNPNIQVGISWGLPLLMAQGVLKRSQAMIDEMDYVGISFYPHLRQFYTKIGGVDISAPPQQWRNPLSWLADNVISPIAICETGYSSTPVKVPEYGLDMQGSPEVQSQFVRELAQISRRDNYLFTVFFLAIDFDRLRRRLDIPVMKFWEHSGFFDEKLQPKPAWETFKRHWLAHSDLNKSLTGKERISPPDPVVNTIQHPNSYRLIVNIPFKEERDAFQSFDKVTIAKDGVMRWEFKYKRSWAWILKELSAGFAKKADFISFMLRSDSSGSLYLQLKESGGEAFFRVLEPTSDWELVTLPMNSFELDADTKSDGLFNSSIIESIMFADSAGAEDGKTGSRLVEIRDLKFLQ